MHKQTYSVLMSIYDKEKSQYLKEALDSILSQTVPPTQVVIVKDGQLTEELDSTLAEYKSQYPELFDIVSYSVNHGLGYALSVGVEACTSELIARMDTDDVSYPSRIEKQLEAFRQDPTLDFVGTQVIEFLSSIDKPINRSDLPTCANDIRAYSKIRNPFRHPTVMMRKSKVLNAGNYSSKYLYFEDWDLFNRMLQGGCKAINLNEILVGMRVSPEFYERRGGSVYLRHMYAFKVGQLKSGYFNLLDFLISFVPHAFICLMPNSFRSFIYKRMLRMRYK